jgi:6-pyruvoyltetrahydropterin/6-carboxytetrahydropterin synthase
VDPALGWLVDYAEITGQVEPLLKQELDHRCLNDVPGLENPTSEHLSVWLWKRLAERLPGLSSITVAETCTARCTYRGA